MATLGMTEAEREAVERFKRDVVEPSMTALLLLDFWTERSGASKQLAPVLEKVAADYADRGVRLVRINVDEEKLIAAQFRVQSIPTVYAFFQGQPVADLSSVRTEAQLAGALDQILAQLPVQGEAQQLEAEIEPLIAMGEQVLGEGDAERAATIFQQIFDMAPENPSVDFRPRPRADRGRARRRGARAAQRPSRESRPRPGDRPRALRSGAGRDRPGRRRSRARGADRRRSRRP